MPYEVVDPAERDERGVIYPDLTAAMVNASATLEVWELADDEPQTRMVRCWPDPEHEPAAADTAASRWPGAAAKAAERWKRNVSEDDRIKQFVSENTGRAEREATAILAEYNPLAPDKVHAVVSLAWGRGFVAGFAAGHEAFATMLDALAQGDRP